MSVKVKRVGGQPWRIVRTCPLCGEKYSDRSLQAHLLYSHENDAHALAIHLAEALQKLLNRRSR
jgi:hypothetical protein